MKDYEHLYLKKLFHELNPVCATTGDYLYMNLYTAFQERLYFKIKQIGKSEYNWLDEDIVGRCKERMDVGSDCAEQIPDIEKTIIHHKMEFEHTKIDGVLVELTGRRKVPFSARVDLCRIPRCELKCVSSITTEHLIQTVVYAWLCRNMVNAFLRDKAVKIFNIKTGRCCGLRLRTRN
jgi:hypothetical protein